jgi:hypothetical protein
MPSGLIYIAKSFQQIRYITPSKWICFVHCMRSI